MKLKLFKFFAQCVNVATEIKARNLNVQKGDKEAFVSIDTHMGQSCQRNGE